jgi:hypothetical protein
MDDQLPFGSPSDDERREALLLYSDGGARGNPGPAAIGAVVLDPAMDPPATLATVSRRIGVATNNVAEYEALIAGSRPRPRTPRRRCGSAPTHSSSSGSSKAATR